MRHCSRIKSAIVAAIAGCVISLFSAAGSSAQTPGQVKAGLNEAGPLVRSAQREHQDCMFAGIRRIGLQASDVRAAAEVIVFNCQRQTTAFRAAMIQEGYQTDWVQGFFDNFDVRMERVVMGIILDEQAKAGRR